MLNVFFAHLLETIVTLAPQKLVCKLIVLNIDVLSWVNVGFRKLLVYVMISSKYLFARAREELEVVDSHSRITVAPNWRVVLLLLLWKN